MTIQFIALIDVSLNITEPNNLQKNTVVYLGGFLITIML